MSIRSLIQKLVVVALVSLAGCDAFVQRTSFATRVVQRNEMYATKNTILSSLETKIITTSAFIIANIPNSVIAAVVEDDYEYGKVDAPIGLAWGVGVLAILTALLPIALKGGEEAFEEIREREQDSFGKNKDVLKNRKK